MTLTNLAIRFVLPMGIKLSTNLFWRSIACRLTLSPLPPPSPPPPPLPPPLPAPLPRVPLTSPSLRCYRFLVEATRLIERHADTEGLFRKSGSVARQKELKVGPRLPMVRRRSILWSWSAMPLCVLVPCALCCPVPCTADARRPSHSCG